MVNSIAYIGLGSNLAEPVKQIHQAFQSLATLPQTQLRKQSGLYQSKPLANMLQPDYINAVAVLETQLPPYILLEHLQAIENQQGRVRGERWGARTLDLDILLYDALQSTDPRLCLPHIGLTQRAFVLYPLYECEPALILPDGTPLEILLQHCPMDGLYRIEN
ncbi:2-amino-4-hydroxy-6-hydroxymethyldihydropteridine diphosphokinase [Beggiatoa leptomitoformis]|uniref:2-amino-4-hydroxy-6-hydroxymethyldihydropteridine pyrophosphokinase n=1 Tax=Beggiatoa leptomitoformis TaxID=288004 RepID=A0A2N9YHB8_9GAMM|nr:2-amino-4-hydroxy-6-hydroxymethyldihydropteridine diphosphokinase [Beggiatoa leptomitoformis]ALG67817.1 2-amino-4-hydroxy-6-hydroxymethyldihydropteridine diphosphokinase [Beggiatoa leptomitoformis]AUI69928.1 2-amino-4-hydroxy-6-hydroxymethyldihydropteridine diphosphokinase [Beggiatoa leptomitoformis]